MVAFAFACALPFDTVRAQAPIFTFESDEFWLNMHKFLYVLGRAQNKFADASRDAVVSSPAEATRGLASLSDAERAIWADAVAAYAQGPSRKDPIFDRDAAALESRLASVDDAGGVQAVDIDAPLRAVLERAAPVYRKAWWESHRASNRAWVSSIQQLLKTHGSTVLQFVTRVYGMPWPTGGYPVHVVAYASWAGAYSTYGNLLLVSTNSGASNSGWGGLEAVFHESIHQWNDTIDAVLAAKAKAGGLQLPRNLWHAIIFFTAGEAVRRVAPAGYVPLADVSGGWERGMTGLKTPLEETWLPYLNGRGTRDEALAALVVRAAAAVPAH